MDTAYLTTPQLEAYLQSAQPGFGQIISVKRAGSGQSNPTFILADEAGRELVLRQKPFGKLLPSAHAIDREYRVMSALAETDIPVPKMIAYCDDADLIGAEFFLMERMQGQGIMDPRMPEASNAMRSAVFIEMAQVLGRLHALDLDVIGLKDYGAPGAYFERGVGRWTKQYRAAQTEDLAMVEDLIAWLDANQPADDQPSTLVHGDYRIDNLLLADEAPHIGAVLDWELSTTGHPLSDLGAVLMQWSLPPGLEGRGLMGVDRASLGIPSNKEFIAAYVQARGGANLRDLPYATAFAFFRMASIIQGVVKRGLDGNASDPEGAKRMAPYVGMFAAGGLQAVAGV